MLAGDLVPVQRDGLHVLSGFVASPPSPDDRIEVVLPAYSEVLRYGPCRYMPRPDVTPKRGDPCVVVMAEGVDPWVAVWGGPFVPPPPEPEPEPEPMVAVGTVIACAVSPVPSDRWTACDGTPVTVGHGWPDLRAGLLAAGSPYGVVGGDPRIPDLRGRAAIGAGQGPGLSDRVPGAVPGVERHALSRHEMPQHDHWGAVTGGGSHAHNIAGSSQYGGTAMTMDWQNAVGHVGWGGYLGRLSGGGGYFEYLSAAPVGDHVHGIHVDGGGGDHENMQPSLAIPHFIRVLK